MPHAFPLLLALLSIEDPLADLRRFPPREHAAYNFALAEASVRRQERELCVVVDSPPACFVHYHVPLSLYSPERAYRIETLHMTRHCRDCWRALRRAHDRGRGDRVASLEELRRLLGEEDWASGQIPPPVPYGRFDYRP